MFKKIFTMFLLFTFCSMQYAFAADPTMINLNSANAFNDNQQELKDVNSVRTSLSTIEKIYNGRENLISGVPLYQVGYTRFKSSENNTAATGKYDSSYKLSIGEKINVLSYGDSVDVLSMSGANLVSPKTTVEVGSNGSIFVPGIGLIRADGRTLGDVEQEANSLARKKYSDMKIKFEIATGGSFSVFIYGEVNKPGKVYVNNNSTIFDALGAAGGVKKTGTLRNIKYNNKSVDLYNTLFLGNDNNIIVKANDKIFVDKIHNTMAIKNGVTVPGIYEFKTGETLGDIIKFSGDLLVTTQRDNDVTIISYDKATKQKTARNVPYLTAKTTKLSDGDTVQFKELYNDVENTVTLQGNVKHPATYAYKEGMRLSDILKSEDELMEETFIYQAVIRRISGQNNVIETIPVYLKEFFAGMNDPILQPRDVITVYKNTNSDFVDVYGCINTPKHIPHVANMTLKDVLSDIQFMESDITSTDKTASDDSISSATTNGEDVQIKVSTENSNKLIPTEKVAMELTSGSGKITKLFYLYDIMVREDAAHKITLNPNDKVFFRTLRDNEIIKTVKISGYVKKPGVYSFIKGQKLTDIIEMAGGLDEDADLRGIIFKRANVREKQVTTAIKNNEKDIRLLEGRLASGYKQDESAQGMKLTMIEQMQSDQEAIKRQYNGQIALNIRSNDLSKISDFDNITMQDGDDIYIPRASSFVSVIGEVYNEQAFLYAKGSNVKRYIKQVGGYTPNANRFRLYKIGISGRSERVHMRTKVEAGDTIVVPRRIAGNDWLTPICDVIKSLATTMFMIVAVRRW